MPEERVSVDSFRAESTAPSPGVKKIVLAYGLTAVGTLAWLTGIFFAPYLSSQGAHWSGLVYALYSPVCHQLASRSLRAWGYPLAVCARCLGIYLGFGAGVIAYPFVRGLRRVALPATGVFLLFSAPIVTDTAGNFLRVWATSSGLRLAIGLLWGTLLPYYFIPGLAELRLPRRR
jgi:uncharacterized membrane protein